LSESQRRAIWDEFRNDAELHRLHNIKPEEVAMLSRVAMLGTFASVDDLIYMLNVIRREHRRQ
jgi:hypothetical protein